MENDWAVTKNPIEAGIFLKHIIIAKRVVVTFIGKSIQQIDTNYVANEKNIWLYNFW